VLKHAKEMQILDQHASIHKYLKQVLKYSLDLKAKICNLKGEIDDSEGIEHNEPCQMKLGSQNDYQILITYIVYINVYMI
jgi:hypothetical protein